MGALLQKDEQVIAEVLEKSRELFRHYGLRKTTMEDIARSLGKGKSTLYYYFKSKTEIFEEIVRRDMQTLNESIRREVARQVTARNRLKAFSDAWFASIREKSATYSVMRSEAVETMESINALRHSFELVGLGQIKDIIIDGIQSGELKRIDAERIDMFAHSFMAILWWTKFPVFAGYQMGAVEGQVHNLIDLLMDGLNS